MKGADGLLLDGLHRYGHDRFAMAGAQDRLGVSPVGLLADAVGLYVLRRKQLDGVAELLRLVPVSVGPSSSVASFAFVGGKALTGFVRFRQERLSECSECRTAA